MLTYKALKKFNATYVEKSIKFRTMSSDKNFTGMVLTELEIIKILHCCHMHVLKMYTTLACIKQNNL